MRRSETADDPGRAARSPPNPTWKLEVREHSGNGWGWGGLLDARRARLLTPRRRVNASLFKDKDDFSPVPVPPSISLGLSALTAAQHRRSSRTGQARRVVVLLLPSRGQGLKGRLKDRPQKSCRSIDDPTPAREEFNFLGRPRTEFLVVALFILLLSTSPTFTRRAIPHSRRKLLYVHTMGWS